MDFPFEDKFCKYFKALRDCFEGFISFNIVQCLSKLTDKISILLYYDEKLDVEKEKRQLDEFAIKCKLSECGWQVFCEFTTYISVFHYESILFNRNCAYTTCFEFRRPTDTTILFCGITDD